MMMMMMMITKVHFHYEDKGIKQTILKGLACLLMAISGEGLGLLVQITNTYFIQLHRLINNFRQVL